MSDVKHIDGHKTIMSAPSQSCCKTEQEKGSSEPSKFVTMLAFTSEVKRTP